MAVSWDLPLKQANRPDVEGGTHFGPAVHLRAMIDDDGEVIALSSMAVNRETLRHFKAQHSAGVRFMVTAEREPNKPIYYKADGTPWMSHHPALVNTSGSPVDLGARADRAMREISKLEEQRRHASENALVEIKRKKREEREAERALNEQRDAMESNPLWGAF